MATCRVPRILSGAAWTPSTVCVRTMKSVNTRRKKPMHIMRAKLMAVTESRPKKDPRSLSEQCNMRTSAQKPVIDKPHLVREFYARLCRQVLGSSKLIAVFHSKGMKVEEQLEMKRRLRKDNIAYKVYGNSIVNEAITGTKLENMHPLFVGSCIIAVSEQPAVRELFKATKRFSSVHLLGGFVEDRLMSPVGMQEYARLPSIKVLQGQLAGLLTSSISRTHSLLQSNQQWLAANLDQLVKQGGEPQEGSPEER